MIREVRPEDAAAITAIYNHYILKTTATFEVEPLTEAEMKTRICNIARHDPYLVCEENGQISGYCYAHKWKERAAYSHTAETTVYLHPAQTGRGLGHRLMEKLIEACKAQGYSVLIACITAENEPSRQLHQRLGFRQVSLFEQVGMKFGRLLDVADYELLLR